MNYDVNHSLETVAVEAQKTYQKNHIDWISVNFFHILKGRICIICAYFMYLFAFQQSDGSVHAHGTGVYEDLPCGLVSH